MKQIITLLALSFCFSTFAQVGIGNTDPNATLDISAKATPDNTDGILIPRLDDFPMPAPTAAQDGMMVFMTGAGTPTKGFYYWNSTGAGTWVAITGNGGGTLDQAYDAGGAGAGRIITADNGAVEVQGSGGIRVEDNIIAAEDIVHDGDANTFMSFTPDRIQFDAGGRNYIDMQHANEEIAFNEDSTESDLRVESGNETHMLFVDGDLDRVGINRNNPQATLQIDGNMDGDGSAVLIRAIETQDGMDIDLTGNSNSATDNVDGININHEVDFTGTGARPSGITLTMNGSTTQANSSVQGLDISINGPSSYLGSVFGSRILDLSSANNTFYGYYVSGGSSGSNFAYGNYNTLSGASTGAIYGTFNFINGLGTGTKYGTYNNIGSTAGGTHYGVYSDVRKADSYAGFFIGRASFGSDGVLNRYLLPAADGTAGQVMTTDGAGNVTFALPTTGVERINDLLDGKSDNDGSEDGSSVFLGIGAGDSDDQTDNRNVGVGYLTLENNTSGENNTGIGYLALNSNETGSQNTAVGQAALTANDAGTGNTGLGYHALFANTGSDNTAVGNGALNTNDTGGFNTSIGTQALFFNNAGSNTASGYRALYTNSSGTRNAAFGLESLNFNISGNDNIAVGYRAGYTATGSGNVFLGSEAGNGATGNNKLFIENTAADEDSALLYGEFGADATTTGNILRTNGELQIGNPTGTGYALPTDQGAANEVLTSNGDGTTAWAAAAGGIPNISNFSLAQIFMNSSSQNITSTSDVKVNFDTVDIDVASDFNTTTDRLVVSQAGIYNIKADIAVNDVGSRGLVISIYVNGVAIKSNYTRAANILTTTITVSTKVNLVATDYVEIFARQNGLGDVLIRSEIGSVSTSSFEIERIR